MLPFGIQSTQIHLNYWKEEDFKNFEKFLRRHQKKIVSFDNILNKVKSGFFIYSIWYYLIYSLNQKIVLFSHRKKISKKVCDFQKIFF